MPTDDTAIRRALDQWLDKKGVHPVLVGEFEDYAMLREFARAGRGFAPVPSILEDRFRREYGFARVGMAEGVKSGFYAITVDRRVKHPAVALLTQKAGKILG